MTSPTPSPFVFFTCQPGAEPALKRELAVMEPEWRLAFSRPGFVSFKCAESAPPNPTGGRMPVFARTRSISLGRVSDSSLEESSRVVWQLEGLRAWIGSSPIGGLHVWQRDTQLPGEGDFEPSVTPLAEEVRKSLLAAARETDGIKIPGGLDSSIAPQGAAVVDVVLVAPNEWYVGWHRAESRIERWPGGMLPVAAPEDAISRAYLKMEEALRWTAFPAERGDQWVELGCAPGGSCQALVDRGFRVIGIDPAEVEEPLARHPQFQHLRKRSAEVQLTELAKVRWLAADLSATPQYTLDAVEEIVRHPATSIRGLALTLKLTSWELATPEKMQQYVKRVQSWGFHDVRLRQLLHNRREIFLAALRSRGQRRMTRRRKRQKTDSRGPQEAASHPPTDNLRFDAPIEQVSRHHFR